MPKYPLYIPTKGRAQYMMTSKALTQMGVHHYLIVEPQEIDDYRAAIDRFHIKATLLPLDFAFKERYELLDRHGFTKSTGPGPARNFAWQHALDSGHAWHWVMDDNIRVFYRLNKNLRVPIYTPEMWNAMEDFVDRYSNLAMAGPTYKMFAPSRSKFPPFIINTRIYSCNLIRNDVPFRWRGRYNEDTILSLDMLKAGWCTIQFYAFLQNKLNTQTLPGGNTDAFYWAEGKKIKTKKYALNGTLAKSQMLAQAHPDVTRIVHKYGRVHHHVDYKRFKQRLIRRKDCIVQSAVNEYGMRFVQRPHLRHFITKKTAPSA